MAPSRLSLTGRCSSIVSLFGLLGGSFSAALKVPESANQSRIPELIGAIRVTLLRIVVGSVSAIVIFIVLNSAGVKGLFWEVFNQPDLKTITPPIVFLLAFVAGFSERLVLKSVEFFVKEKK